MSSTPVHRWRAFSLLAVCMFMTVIDLTIVNTALPTIGRKLHFSESNLLWVVNRLRARVRRLSAARRAGRGSPRAFIFIGTLYMQQVLHYTPLQGGIAWLAATPTSIAFAGVAQLLVTRGSAKPVMAFGVTLIGVGILWATPVPVYGHFWANMFGPLFVIGIGTAFAFVPISIAALAGVAEHEAGLASGLIYTSQELGGALGIAIASASPPATTRRCFAAGTPPAPLSPAAFIRRSGCSAVSRYSRSRSRSCSSAGMSLQRQSRAPRSETASPPSPPPSSYTHPASHARTHRRQQMRTVMVRYQVQPGRADENKELIRAVYEELRQTLPEGIRYATFHLDDGVSFIHLHSHESIDNSNALTDLPAFKKFQQGIPDRCEDGPVVTELCEIGSFRFFDGQD